MSHLDLRSRPNLFELVLVKLVFAVHDRGEDDLPFTILTDMFPLYLQPRGVGGHLSTDDALFSFGLCHRFHRLTTTL